MNKLREICQEKLSNPAQDIEASNRMWNRRAKEVSRLSARADGDGYFSFFKSSVGDLDGMSVLDSGCGAGRYLKLLLDAEARAEGLDSLIEMVRTAKAYTTENGYADVPVRLATCR